MSRLKSSERRMRLILMLQDSKKNLTVKKLADTFGVTKRTIYRDFAMLSELEVPVVWERYSGYGLVQGYKIPPLMFTSKELATIMVGLNFVKSQVDKNLIDDAKGVEIKIKNVLPEDLKQFMNSLENHTIVDPFLHFGHEKKEGGNWYIVSSAISQKKRLQFQYESQGEGKTSDREIDPYLLVFYRDHWNIIGFSHKRGEIRNFILDRMQNAKILDQNFEQTGEMNVEALIFGSNEAGQLVELKVEESADRPFRANLPTKIFKEEALNNKIIKVSFYFDNLDFLNEWLLQFGEKVKIISPKSLIEKRKSLLNKMIDNISI